MKLIPTVILISFTISLFSQSIIKGQLTDEHGEPMAFANALLLTASDSTLVQGVVTDEAGLYSIRNVPYANYLLSFTMIGYNQIYHEILVNQSVYDHGATRMTPSATQLETIEVKANRPLFEQQIDRMVVNVEHSITSAGGTALEILEKSPGVLINRQSNAITMAGKEGVVVMINGKESRMPANALLQMLAGMPASNIEKIELISTPPASFDAEGEAGYINIVLKSNIREGTNGSATLISGYGKAEKYGGNINLNYRIRRLGIYADYSFMLDRTPQIFKNFRRLETNGDVLATSTRSIRNSTQRDHNYRIGFEYDLTDKTTIGGLYSGYDNRWSMDALNDTRVTRNNILDTTLQIYNEEINHWQHHMGNINLQHKFDENTTLIFDADYLYYFDNNPTDYINTYMGPNGELLYEEEVRTGKETPINIYVAKVDFTKDWGDGFRFSGGLKGTISQFDNDIRVETLRSNGWVFDPDLTQKYDLKEKIGAAYSSVNFKLSDKTSMSAGLRYEFTDSYLSSEQEEGIVDREYGILFPSLYIGQDINENNHLQFSYSRRIRRPTFNDMAPFVIFMDPNTFFSGNPALQPAITDAIKLDYRYKKYFFSAQYSYDDEAIANFQPSVNPETNKQTFAAINLDYRQTINISLTIPFYPTDWWEMQNNISGNWQQNKGLAGREVAVFEQKSYSLFTSQAFKLPKAFRMEVSGFYSSPVLFGITRSDAFGTLNFGLEKKFNEGNSTMRFAIQDILQTNVWASSAYIPENATTLDVYLRFQNRTFRLTYTYNFGNNKVKTARERETGSEDERQRVN
jgi:hypothetical protein